MGPPRGCIDIDGRAVVLGGTTVLSGLDLRVDTGEKVAVVGANGAGKTTLLRAVLGLARRTAGSVRVFGDEVGSRAWRRGRGRVGWVSQESVRTDFPFSAEEVVGIGALASRSGGSARADRVEEAMRRAGCLGLRGKVYGRLSGGERQKVSLARCLCQGPLLLLLDEPTTALDAESRSSIRSVLDGLGADGVTVVAVSHDRELTGSPGWRAVRLEGGRLVEDGG
jgi:ABC-type Mn2+/Zn2+ transport system ATPase subunit